MALIQTSYIRIPPPPPYDEEDSSIPPASVYSNDLSSYAQINAAIDTFERDLEVYHTNTMGRMAGCEASIPITKEDIKAVSKSIQQWILVGCVVIAVGILVWGATQIWGNQDYNTHHAQAKCIMPCPGIEKQSWREVIA